jgi:hypothetical protein
MADPVRDGTNWFAYVNNDPVNYIDPWGLDSMYSTYIRGSGKIVSTYIPTNPDGTRDYTSIKTYSFSASNDVTTNIKNTILEDGSTGEYYYPQNFPTGTWDVEKSRKVSPDEEQARYLGTVFVRTTAHQTVQTYGTEVPSPGDKSTGTQEDYAYGVHFRIGSTAGCLAIGTQEEMEQFAALSDKALESKDGKSTLTAVKGK